MRSLGVVLGGGGARGLAHIGVLSTLDQAGLRPDVLVGVSMGAVIGATYAAREDWLAALDSMDTSDLPGHPGLGDAEGFELVREVVRTAVRMAPKVVSFGRTGYLEFGRQAMAHLLGGTPTFEALRLPFAAVATDLTAGRRAVLDTGDVAGAVIASAALPVLTRPVEHEGSRFLDGGFADPAPIDVARSMGADVVLMVHVGTPMSDPSGELDGPIGGVLRGVEIGAQRFVEVRLREADVVVAPTFGAGTSWLSFDRAADLVRVGATSTARVVEDVRAQLDDGRG